MDLGSLELQIFVSLTVVLGGAFVALVCDYLKGNNEQLREHNIELRVRKEEQERKLLLDPVGFLGQMLPGGSAGTRPASSSASAGSRMNRPASVHEVMQSFAAPEALMEAETRASRLHARNPEEEYDLADVPPMTQRRGRPRPGRKPVRNGRTAGESYADWVRPEVIARVARQADAAAAYATDIREELDTVREEELPQPLNAAENWDIRKQIAPNREKPVRAAASDKKAGEAAKQGIAPAEATAEVLEPAAVSGSAEPSESRLSAEEAAKLQREIERVSQLERQPATPAPGTIQRPLTVPSLKLEEELQRVAEPAAWNSALLDEVIAASELKPAETGLVPGNSAGAAMRHFPAVASEFDYDFGTPAVSGLAPLRGARGPESDAKAFRRVVVPGPHGVAKAPEPVAVTADPEAKLPEISTPVEYLVEELPEPVAVEAAPEVALPVVSTPVEYLVEELPEPVAIEAAPEVALPVVSTPVEYLVEELPEPVAIEAAPEVALPVVSTPVEYLVEELPEPVAIKAAPEVALPVASTPVEYLVEELPEPVAIEAAPEVALPVMSTPVEYLVEELPEPVAVEAPPVVTWPVVSMPATFVLEAASEPTEVERFDNADLAQPVSYLFEIEAETPFMGREPEAAESRFDGGELPFLIEVESETGALAVEPPPFVTAIQDSAEAVSAAAEGAFFYYEIAARRSRLAGMGVSPVAEYLPTLPGVLLPLVQIPLAESIELAPVPLPATGEADYADSIPELLPELLPAEPAGPWTTDTRLASDDGRSVDPAPPPFWESARLEQSETTVPVKSAPIEIFAARQQEAAPAPPPAPTIPDLLMPTGMHDSSTWNRLLSLPNPMTGILFVITLQPSENTVPTGDRKSAPPTVVDNGPAIDRLMASFVREGDFGTQIAENEWVFVYSHDVAGFNQRRVGLISEKLWDFQLRHLGMTNISFKWGAVDVKSEPLGEAVSAARDRMNQTRRARKLPGADPVVPRRVVNG